MSAEVQAAESVIRVVAQGVESVIRVTIPLATSVGTLAIRGIVLGLGQITGGSLNAICKSEQGPAYLSIRDDDYPKLIEAAKKLHIPLASVDITPNDGWTDVVCKRSDFTTIGQLVEALNMTMVKRTLGELSEPVIEPFGNGQRT